MFVGCVVACVLVLVVCCLLVLLLRVVGWGFSLLGAFFFYVVSFDCIVLVDICFLFLLCCLCGLCCLPLYLLFAVVC